MRNPLGNVALMLAMPAMCGIAHAATLSSATLAIGAEVAQSALVEGSTIAMRDVGDACRARASACRSDPATVTANVTRVDDHPEPGLPGAHTVGRQPVVQIIF